MYTNPRISAPGLRRHEAMLFSFKRPQPSTLASGPMPAPAHRPCVWTGRILSRRVLTPLSLLLGGVAIGILPACKSDSATSETTGGDEVDINVGGASPETDPIPSGEPESPEYPQIKSLQGPVQAALGQILTFVVTSDFEPEGEVVDMAVVLPDESIWFKVPVAALPAPNSSPGKWQYSVTVALGSSQALAGSSIKLEFALMNPAGAGGYEDFTL